jgi:hypothetical protein
MHEIFFYESSNVLNKNQMFLIKYGAFTIKDIEFGVKCFAKRKTKIIER